MLASRQVEIPFQKGIGRQRDREFRALAQIIGRTAIAFLLTIIVAAAKRVSVDFVEFLVPKIAEVVGHRKIFKTAAKSVYINNQQIYNSNGLNAHKSFFSTNSREPFLNTREVCTATCTTKKMFLMEIMKRLCLNLFSQREWKCLADPMASCFMVIWGLTFSPLLNCYIQIWKSSYD